MYKPGATPPMHEKKGFIFGNAIRRGRFAPGYYL